MFVEDDCGVSAPPDGSSYPVLFSECSLSALNKITYTYIHVHTVICGCFS